MKLGAVCSHAENMRRQEGLHLGATSRRGDLGSNLEKLIVWTFIIGFEVFKSFIIDFAIFFLKIYSHFCRLRRLCEASGLKKKNFKKIFEIFLKFFFDFPIFFP